MLGQINILFQDSEFLVVPLTLYDLTHLCIPPLWFSFSSNSAPCLNTHSPPTQFCVLCFSLKNAKVSWFTESELRKEQLQKVNYTQCNCKIKIFAKKIIHLANMEHSYCACACAKTFWSKVSLAKTIELLTYLFR